LSLLLFLDCFEAAVEVDKIYLLDFVSLYKVADSLLLIELILLQLAAVISFQSLSVLRQVH